MPRDMLLLHVPVSTKRPWIHYFKYPNCDCSELNNAAAQGFRYSHRNGDPTPAATQIGYPCQVCGGRGGGGRSASMLSELHHSHQSIILIILFVIVVH